MELDGRFLLFVLILVGVIFLLVYIRKKFKILDLPCVFFVSGAVKSGKTLLSVHLAIKEYKRNLRLWHIRRWLVRIFLPMKYHDKYDAYYEWKASDFKELPRFDFECAEFPPMLYTNIPLAMIKYNPLTIDIIRNSVRIPNKSVCLIDEVSLFADSQLFKDKITNNVLMRFYKLYGHYSHGGKLIIDSQSIADNHFALRRCMSSYLYIQQRKKFPLFSLLYVREMIYSEDGSAVNNFQEDIELCLRKVLILNTTYGKYDSYCYSVFTDYLPYQVCYDTDIKSKKDDLKCSNIVTLNEFVKSMNFIYNHRDIVPVNADIDFYDNGVIKVNGYLFDEKLNALIDEKTGNVISRNEVINNEKSN